MKLLSVITIAALFICGSVLLPVLAQNPASGTSPAKSLNMFAYPRNRQNADKQLKDENECYASAKQQTGIDPKAPPPPGKTAEQKEAAESAAGAVAGTMKGGMQQRKASSAAQQQAAANTGSAKQKEDEQIKQEHAAKLDTFKRAFAACMDARGYSVK